MLSRLTISNYTLIDELTVNFEPGFNIITGETGAGKSIILGALSLILGARADTSAIRNTEKKCVIEGAFRLNGLQLESFFTENDLDFDNNTILRREITPAGKTRAFINDTPVNLQQIRDMALRLVDIHSQHQNLELNDHQFQIQIVDLVAKNKNLLQDYLLCFNRYNILGGQLKSLREHAAKISADLDYYEFQYNQLHEASLQSGEQQELEEERQKLSHAEEIKSALVQVNNLLDGEHLPVLQQLKEALGRLDKITPFLKESFEFHQRIESAYIELQDLAHETGYLAENTEFNPQRLDEITQRLDLLYSLQQKHHLESVEQLIELRESFEKKIAEVTSFDDEILKLEKEFTRIGYELKEASSKLSQSRKSVFGNFEHKVMEVLKQLAIPHAVFKVAHHIKDSFTPLGADQIQFLFSANKNGTPDEISRIASGGEISRVMLALKTLISGSRMLPTIIFDEIDAGISGEVALKTGAILKKLSADMQVINITHLPQIAGMGDHHYKVFKYETDAATLTSIRKLDKKERIEELATMLGGANPSETARKTARELMQVGY
jgi:DNA repair protein RecN (Recombination protein N)